MRLIASSFRGALGTAAGNNGSANIRFTKSARSHCSIHTRSRPAPAKSVKAVFVVCHRRSDHQAHDFLLNLRFSEDERQKISSLGLCFNDLELFSRCSAFVVCLRPCRVSTFFRYGPFPETTIQLRSTITQPSTPFLDSFGTAPASGSVFPHVFPVAGLGRTTVRNNLNFVRRRARKTSQIEFSPDTMRSEFNSHPDLENSARIEPREIRSIDSVCLDSRSPLISRIQFYALI